MRVIVVALILFYGTIVHAQNLVDVQYHGERKYTFELIFVVPASTEKVFSLLTDYENLNRLNSSILNSEIVAQTPTHTRVKLQAKVCILFVCKELSSVEEIIVLVPQQKLQSDVVPALSEDIESARTVWSLESTKGGTQLTVVSSVQFAFWAPPLIGPMIIKRELRSNVQETIGNIQKLTSQDLSFELQ